MTDISEAESFVAALSILIKRINDTHGAAILLIAQSKTPEFEAQFLPEVKSRLIYIGNERGMYIDICGTVDFSDRQFWKKIKGSIEMIWFNPEKFDTHANFLNEYFLNLNAVMSILQPSGKLIFPVPKFVIEFSNAVCLQEYHLTKLIIPERQKASKYFIAECIKERSVHINKQLQSLDSIKTVRTVEIVENKPYTWSFGSNAIVPHVIMVRK
jgi:hypothetical protein